MWWSLKKKLADCRMNTMQKVMEERLIWAVSRCAQLWDPSLQAYCDLNKISNSLGKPGAFKSGRNV